MPRAITVCATVIVTLLIVYTAMAVEAPELKVQVTPPFSDRLLPYITYKEAWRGTPARKDDVAVPNILIVYGENEHSDVVAEAGKIGFYLGNWVEDIGFSVEHVKNRSMPSLLVNEKLIPELAPRNVIVVGKNNGLIKKYEIKFEQPSVIYKEAEGRKLLFVGGNTKAGTIKAIRYMADVRLNFKSGAYKTFFNFVKLRGYIEKENRVAALETIESPIGLSACGRNMALAASAMTKAPQRVKRHVKYRNEILYRRLPKAVKEENKTVAANLWHEAMKTCYACHQSAGDIPRLRKFNPPESIHSKHHRVAAKFEFGNGCDTCHFEETRITGYD